MKIVHPNSKKCKRSVRVAPVDCERCIRFKYAGKDELVWQIVRLMGFCFRTSDYLWGSRESLRGFLSRGTNARRKNQKRQRS
jgi:hypothetical protein